MYTGSEAPIESSIYCGSDEVSIGESVSSNPSVCSQSSQKVQVSVISKPVPMEMKETTGTGKITRQDMYAVGCVLVTELCERLSFYSIMANLVLFCTAKLGYSSDEAAVVTLVFSGTGYILPVFGGFVADAWLGQFNTLYASGLAYILGLFLLCACGVEYQDWPDIGGDMSVNARKAYFFTALVFVVIGTGGIKSNIGPFGAQQVEHLGSGAVQSYFNWLYWFINIGAILAFTGVAYVQQQHGFAYGYLIPFLSMVFALVVFVTARSKYKDPVPEGSILGKAIRICVLSLSRTPLNQVRKKHGGRYEDTLVDGVKAVIRILPVFALIIVYWSVYSQMSTSFFLQSERMQLTIGTAQLPAAMLNIFNSLIIIVLIPVMDGIVYPLLQKHNRNPSSFQRMGIGMIMAAFAMLYAGTLEMIRKNDISEHGYIQQTLSGQKFNASRLNMFTQIPEFALIGSSEVFTSISGLEFAYTQSPPSMQGLIMGLFLMTSGLGSYLTSLITVIVKAWKTSEASDWYPAEPNNGHMEYTMYLLATLTFVNLLLFILLTRWYTRKKLPLLEHMEGDPENDSVLY